MHSSSRHTPYILNSQDAFKYFEPCFGATEVEEVWALALRSNQRAINSQMLFRGTVDSCLFHPRELFLFAIQSRASKLIVAHNHPSNEILPTRADLITTQKMIKSGLLLSIPVLDHLIVGKGSFLSLADCKAVCFKSGKIHRHLEQSLI